MASQDRSSTGPFRGALKCVATRLPAAVAYAALAGIVMPDGASSASPLPSTAGVTLSQVFAGAGTPSISSPLSAAEGGTPMGPNAGGGGDPNPPVTAAPCPVLRSPEIRGGQRRLTPPDAQKNGPCGPAATPPIALPAPNIEHAPPRHVDIPAQREWQEEVGRTCFDVAAVVVRNQVFVLFFELHCYVRNIIEHIAAAHADINTE